SAALLDASRSRAPRSASPLVEPIEGALEEGGAASATLDLPARRLRDAARRNERDGVRGERVMGGDRLAHVADDRGHVDRGVLAADLLNDDETFVAVDLDAEGRAATRPERGVARLHRALDVVRRVIPAADDDHVFQTPGDVERALVN